MRLPWFYGREARPRVELRVPAWSESLFRRSVALERVGSLMNLYFEEMLRC